MSIISHLLLVKALLAIIDERNIPLSSFLGYSLSSFSSGEFGNVDFLFALCQSFRQQLEHIVEVGVDLKEHNI